MHKRNRTETAQETTTPDITWFTPSVGATSTNCVLFNLLQNRSLICALSCIFLQSLKAAHTAADLSLILLAKPSAHIATEVVHAHSWDLTFFTKSTLTLP